MFSRSVERFGVTNMLQALKRIPMGSDRRTSFLFDSIFFDEPASTSSKNALGNADAI